MRGKLFGATYEALHYLFIRKSKKAYEIPKNIEISFQIQFQSEAIKFVG